MNFDGSSLPCYTDSVPFIGRLFLKTATNAGALWIAARFISGFEIDPRTFWGLDALPISPLIQTLIIGGIVLALLNLILRPILKFISFPVIFLTFGLFHIVINIAILYLADLWLAELVTTSFQALFMGSLFIGIVNALL